MSRSGRFGLPPRRSCWGDTGGDSNPSPLHLPPPPASPSPSPEKAGGKARGFQGGRRRGARFSLLCDANKKLAQVGAVGGGCSWLQLMAAASVVCGGGGDCGSAAPWHRAVRRGGCAGPIRAHLGRIWAGWASVVALLRARPAGGVRPGRGRCPPPGVCTAGMPDPGQAGLGRAPALRARSGYVGRVQRLLAATAMPAPLMPVRLGSRPGGLGPWRRRLSSVQVSVL
jgi:hypothetical protein